MPKAKELPVKTQESTEAPVDEKSKVKEFTPQKNDLLGNVGLSQGEIDANESAAEAAAEEKRMKSLEDKTVTTPNEKNPEDDFKIPLKDDEFDIANPLNLDDFKGKKEVKPDENVILEKKEENSAFRDQIKEANKRADESSVRFDAMKSENDLLKKRIDEMQSGLNDAQQKLSHKDPSQHPEVKSLVDPWDRKLNSLAQQMSLSGGNGRKLKADAEVLVQLFQGLGSEESDGFDDRKSELIDNIEENYPEDKREVITILAEGANVMNDVTSLIQRIKDNGDQYEEGKTIEVYEAMAKDYGDLEKHFFSPTEDMRQNDPYHHRCIHRDYIDSNEKFKERSLKTAAEMRFAFMPLTPIGSEEMRGMDETALSSYKQKRVDQHKKVQLKVRDMATEAFFSHALLPLVQYQLDNALKELAGVREGNPKPSGGSDDLHEKPESEVSKVEDFDPGRSNLKI